MWSTTALDRIVNAGLRYTQFPFDRAVLANAICKDGALSTHYGACRSEFAVQLIVPSLHPCDRKKGFTVHGLRKVGIRLQLQLYRATACDAQWFSRGGLLLGPSPEHGRNHRWWRRVSCSAHFVFATIPS
jgi:hypothetical protein